MRFLIDTTVLIDHAHGMAGAAELLERLFSEPHELLVCDVVVTEALSKGPDEEMLVIGTRSGRSSMSPPTRKRHGGRASRAVAAARPVLGRSPTRSSPASPRTSRLRS